jgi:hypothetical protein
MESKSSVCTAMCDWVANVLGSRSEVEAMVVDESKEEVWRRAAPASAAMSVPAQLADVPPYQLQSLVASVNEPGGPFSLTPAGVPNEVRCAQALGAEVNPECSCARADLTRAVWAGSEIYVGCSNGELLRYAIEEHGPTRVCRECVSSGSSG